MERVALLISVNRGDMEPPITYNLDSKAMKDSKKIWKRSLEINIHNLTDAHHMNESC